MIGDVLFSEEANHHRTLDCFERFFANHLFRQMRHDDVHAAVALPYFQMHQALFKHGLFNIKDASLFGEAAE
jgi:hypothetical protein